MFIEAQDWIAAREHTGSRREKKRQRELETTPVAQVKLGLRNKAQTHHDEKESAETEANAVDEFSTETIRLSVLMRTKVVKDRRSTGFQF